MKRKSLLLFLLMISFYFNSNGQLSFGGSSEVDVLTKHFDKRTSNNISITPTDHTGSRPVTWQYCIITDGSDTCDLTDLSEEDENSLINLKRSDGAILQGFTAIFTDTNKDSVKIIANSPSPSQNLKIRIGMKSLGQSLKSRVFDLTFRDPFDLVLVLDISGSMNCPLDNCTSSSIQNPPSNSRLALMKEALQAMIDKSSMLENQVIPADNISTIFFAGDSPNITNTTNTTLNPVSLQDIQNGNGSMPEELESAFTAIDSYYSTRSKGGTSIGNGLIKAIKQLQNSGDKWKKVVMIFTDGDENQEKKIKNEQVNGNTEYYVLDENNLRLWLTGDNANNLEVDIFTICAQTSMPSTSSMLQDIASKDNYFQGIHSETDQTIISNFFSEIGTNFFNSLFEDNSPNLIGFKDLLMENNMNASFEVNKNSSALVFEAFFDYPVAGFFNYSLEKNGEVIRTSNKSKGKFFHSFIINNNDLTSIKSEGKWELKLNIKNNTYQDSILNYTDSQFPGRGNFTRIDGSNFQKPKVRLSATSDDHNVDIESLTGNILDVGKKLKLVTKFTRNGKSLDNAKVEALIIKPGDDLSDILAKVEGHTLNSNDDPDTRNLCDAQRYQFLQSTPQGRAKLNKVFNRKLKTVKLTQLKNGIYTGSYDDVDVKGVYKIIFTATKNDSDLGIITRTMEKTVYIGSGEIKRSNSNPKVGKLVKDKNNMGYTITLRPSDKNGLLLGSGFENSINIKGNNITQNQVVSNCDGSYEINFSTTEKNPEIKVTVLGGEIYKGKLNGFDQPKKGRLVFRGGITIPLKQLDTLYDQSYFGEIGIGYQFNRWLGAELIGGYYDFKKDFQIYGATAYFNFYLFDNPNGYAISASGGGGYYFPKGLDATPGFSLKASASRALNSRWNVSADVGYFYLKEPKDYQFLTAGLGFQYKF